MCLVTNIVDNFMLTYPDEIWYQISWKLASYKIFRKASIVQNYIYDTYLN